MGSHSADMVVTCGIDGHAISLFTARRAVGYTAALTKAVMHGIVRGVINVIQNGGRFISAFASAFVSSAFSVGRYTFGRAAVFARTAVMAMVGGFASVISGGKFLNGAVSAAFVHLFNAERGRWRGSVSLKRIRQELLKKAKNGHLTLEEANNWYRYGRGKPLYVDGNRLRYHVVGKNSNGTLSAIVVSSRNDFLVFGHVTVNPENGRIYYDKYDFDFHGYDPIRNIETLIGGIYAGSGTPFEIRIDYTGKWRNQ